MRIPAAVFARRRSQRLGWAVAAALHIAVPLGGAALFALAQCAAAQAPATAPAPAPARAVWNVAVAAGDIDRSNLPLRARVVLPAGLAAADGETVKLKLADGSRVDGQLVPTGLLASDGVLPAEAAAGDTVRDVLFMLPKLPAGSRVELEAELPAAANGKEPRLQWAESDACATLLVAGKPLLRYEMPAYDDSSAETRVKTYKPFHHVFDPATGIRLTKGDGGLYTHHRGIFFGYNRISHGEALQTASDCWHCKGRARQEHRDILAQVAGSVAAVQQVVIDWIGSDGLPLAEEIRELTAVPARNGTVIEFASRLAADAAVRLDGDPQHAGVHFRAASEVAESTKGETYYLRPDGRAEPGQFRNWPQDMSYVDAPWHAASFVVGGQRYTVLRINRPANPGEARMSERDYARFGSYFEHDLEPELPLLVGYRFWVQPGEMTVEDAARIAADYATPAEVVVEAVEAAAEE
jgi:hypothetical protein